MRDKLLVATNLSNANIVDSEMGLLLSEWRVGQALNSAKAAVFLAQGVLIRFGNGNVQPERFQLDKRQISRRTNPGQYVGKFPPYQLTQEAGVGQADVYQMMAYAHVYECNRLMLLYPHHYELAEEAGMVAIHQIANKRDSLIGIATVGLADPKGVKPFLKKALFKRR